VQLIRNGLCCIKDLDWFRDTFPVLYDSGVLPQYYDLPEPYNKTTPLEALIGLTQFYAFSSNSRSGWKLLHTSYGKLVRVQRLLESLPVAKTDSDRLIRASLIKEAMYALRSMFIGFLVLSIGISFFWVVGNSFHATESDVIGGLPALIHALTVMEVALLPLLYYMWMDSGEQLKKAARLEAMAREMQALKDSGLKTLDIDLASFEALTNWLPFWDSGVSAFESKVPDSAVEEKMILEEKYKVQRSLEELTDKAKISNLKEKADELMIAGQVTRLEGYREFIYFIMNFIAFYGYLFCVLAYYFEDESKPYSISILMFALDNDLADWYGNFAGDLMWTIEPVIIFSTAYLFTYMRNSAKRSKVKSD